MTIKDIAKLAQVSVSTVSKVLNQKDEEISEETRKKVLKIVKEYQYTPYSKVKEAMQGRSYTFAILLPKDLWYKDELLTCIEQEALINGYQVLVYVTTSFEEEQKYIQILSGKHVDAILLYSIGTGKESRIIQKTEKIPFLWLQEKKEQQENSQIFFSYEKASYLAAQHLITQGHRKIGLLLCESRHNQEVKAGYQRALFENDILYEADKIFLGKDSEESSRIGAHQMINKGVSGVICDNESIACGMYFLCSRHGMRIPEDISVVGIHTRGIAKLLYPSLTCVTFDFAAMGKTIVAHLLERLEGAKTAEVLWKEIRPVLQMRESVTKPFERVDSGRQKIVVVGSMNVDLLVNVEKMPTEGETLLVEKMTILPGGKGLNQATAAGKLGGLVYAVGCLGNDSDGKKLYHCLVQNGVKTEGIQFQNGVPTGKAYITVAEQGESTIVVYRGANECLVPDQIQQQKRLFQEAIYCLLSLEIKKDTAVAVLQLCQETGTKVLVKPSAIEVLEDDILCLIEYLIPNEKELHKLVPEEGSIEEKAERLLQKGVKTVLVTLGKKGCYLRNREYNLYFEAASFAPLDTTGAADAFISAFAVAMSEGKDILYSIVFASYGAGISIGRAGAQPAMPDRMTLEVYRDEIAKTAEKMIENSNQK